MNSRGSGPMPQNPASSASMLQSGVSKPDLDVKEHSGMAGLCQISCKNSVDFNMCNFALNEMNEGPDHSLCHKIVCRCRLVAEEQKI